MIRIKPGPNPPGRAVLVLALLACGPARADDWNTGVGGKPSRHGASGEVGPTEPRILWEGSEYSVIAQQAVIEGNVLVTNRIFNLANTQNGTNIVAHDLTTGRVLWSIQLPIDFPATAWRSRVTAIRDGQVYATRAGNTNLDYLYALRPTDGSIIWRSADLINETSTESLSFAANGDIIAGNFNALLRINRVDGTRVWNVPRTCPTSDSCHAAVFGDRAYIWEASPTGPVITAFDLATGARRYSSPGLGGLVQQIGPLVGPDGTVYAPRTQNNPATDYFVAFEDTGAALVEKWRVALGYVPFASFGVGPDGSVYTYSRDREVLRLDPDTGAIRDRSMLIPSDFHQPRMAIDAAGRVFVTNGGFSQGALFSFNTDLSFRWSVPVPSVNIGGPAMGQGGKLAVCGVGTDLRVFQTLPGDLDEDGDIDLSDFTIFQLCFGGSNNAPAATCPPGTDADLDGDGDVDLADFLIFQQNFTGSR